MENKALNTAHELSKTLSRQSSILKHADQALEGVKKIEKSIESELQEDKSTGSNNKKTKENKKEDDEDSGSESDSD